MSSSFHWISFALQNILPVLSLAAFCYLFYVLHRRHLTTWSLVGLLSSCGALLCGLLIATLSVGMTIWWMRATGPAFDLPTEVWYGLWVGEVLADIVSGIALLAMAMQARRDRQVAQMVVAG